MGDNDEALEVEDHSEPEAEQRADGERFTLEDIMALTYPERLAIADESGLTGDDLEAAKAPPHDPDHDLIPQEPEKQEEAPDTEDKVEKGDKDESEAEKAAEEPPPEEAPQKEPEKVEVQKPSAHPPAEPEPTPDTAAMQSRLEELKAEREALLASFEEMDIEPDAFREKDEALVEEMVGLRADIVATERAEQARAREQQASDEAWYAAVGAAMQKAEIPAEGERAQAFDVILRRYEEVRPDLPDGDKITSAVEALSTIEKAQIGPEIFPGFEAILRTIEVQHRDIPERDKISLAVKAFAAAQEAAGAPLAGDIPDDEKSEAKDAGRPERPAAPTTLAGMPTDGPSGMSDGGQVAALMERINSGMIDPIEAERMMAQIPESQWTSETRRMPGNDYAGYAR